MYTPSMRDEKVKAATGKKWSQWFALLDKAGSRKKSHTEIARWVFDKYLGKKGATTNVATSGGWWSQMVTVEYERARGLREKNQNDMGYMVAVHKTFDFSKQEFVKRWKKLLQEPGVKARKLVPLPTTAKNRLFYYQMAHGRLIVGWGTSPSGKLRIVAEAVKLSGQGAVKRERNFWKKMVEKIA
jgi:hypothetical protein